MLMLTTGVWRYDICYTWAKGQEISNVHTVLLKQHHHSLVSYYAAPFRSRAFESFKTLNKAPACLGACPEQV